MSLFSELRRRSVFRVAASYVVVGWVIVQVVSDLHGPLNLPEWFETVVVVLLAIGFPLALLFAWAFELTPDGIKPTEQPGGRIQSTRNSRLDYALIGGLIVVAGVTIWDQIPSRSNATSPASATAQPQSIAVLPFADLSQEGDQAYFGDGIAEELLNALTRLEGLKVAGRTSSFSFRRTDEDPQTIGERLGVNSILEGSVRKDGERIRITAQLINAADGYQLWSEIYDRDLTDIFSIQEEIARSVAGELGVRLGVGGVNAFRGAGTRNVEAYEAYLEGLALGAQDEAIHYFERATELDSDYAVAWAQLGLRTSAQQWTSNPEEAPEIRDRAYAYVSRAVALDPESAQSTALLGTALYSRRDWIDGHEAHLRAQSMLADRGILIQHGNLLMRAGRSAAAQEQFEAAQAIEPLAGRTMVNGWHVSLALGRPDEARRQMIERSSDIEAIKNGLSIALNERDPDEIKAALAAMPPADISTNALYRPVLREFDSPERVLSTLRAVYSDDNTRWPSKLHDIGLLAAYFGDPVFALQAIGEEVRYTGVRQQVLWYPLLSEVRQLPGFKQLVTDINLVAYWRMYGWPDVCGPLGPEDFECS